MLPTPRRNQRDWIDRLLLAILIVSLLSGLLLRTYRMDWDKGHQYSFHPDERAVIYSAISNISFPIPPDINKLLRPDSPLNPHFFNYGNLPMYLTRITAHFLSFVIKNAWTNENLWMSGRGLSALFDLFTIVLVFLLGRKLYGRRVGILAAIFGSFTVLHIQLSHFLTVDTFVTTFITLGMYFAIDIVRKGSLKAGLLMGMSLGFAMGTKASVAPLVASVFVAWGVWAWRGSSDPSVRAQESLTPGDRFSKAILGALLAVIAALFFFVAAMPYAIIDWTNFIRSVDEQSRMVRGIADYPYTRQYLNTPVFLYQIWQTGVWGMGVPLGIVAYAGFVFVTLRTLARRSSEEIVLLSWVAVYFFINGIFQVKFMRYMLPLFPFLFIMGSELLWQMWDWAGRVKQIRLGNPFRVPVAYAKGKDETEDEYLHLDAESEEWEREKARQAGVPPRPVRHAGPPARRRPRQVSVGGVRQAKTEPVKPVAMQPEEGALQPAPLVAPPTEAPTAPVAPPLTEPARVAIAAEGPDDQFPAALPPAIAALPEAPLESPPQPQRAPQPAPPVVVAAEGPEPPPAPTLETVRSMLSSSTTAQRLVGVVMILVVASTILYALAFMNIYRGTHPWIAISEWIYRNVPPGTTMAIEHWDDALPLGRRIDGKQRSFEEYKHVEMKNYEDDNQAKLDMLVANLQQADYLVLATNRLYTTLARLPDRYPVTSRYYQLLFAEKLGFRLVAAASLHPSVLGVTFVDDPLSDAKLARPPLLVQTKPSGLVINLGKVDESFTVYDHPMPLIFQKVERIGEPELRAMFDGAVQKFQEYQQKRQARLAGRPASAKVTKTFLLTEKERDAQEAGGDYMSLFNPDSLANRLPVLVWWLAVELIGLACLPIGFVVFGALRDRGYAIQKTLGLLLVAYLPWLAASFKIVPFGQLSIVLSIIVTAAASAVVYRSRQAEIMAWLRQNKWLVLVNEVVFAVAFLAFVYIRVLNPDLWQPWNGGEKPMEFAFLSAIARSTYFPPYDPFFAGGYINYYYYGQYICAMLIRLVGIEPSVGFNLVIPLLFALTFANAFSITFNLVAGLRQKLADIDIATGLPEFLKAHGSLLAWAIVGACFVVVIGNLATVGEVFKGPWNKGQTTIKSSLPGLTSLAKVADGLLKATQPNQRVFEPFNYWNPSRVIPDTINEFPFWSYLFADLHPHTIGIPFTLLILGLSLSLMKQNRSIWSATTPDVASSRLTAALQRVTGTITAEDVLLPTVFGLAVGSLGAINTWDLPTYLGVILCAFLLRSWIERGRPDLVEAVARFGSVAVLCLALYLPFYQNYQALASGIGLVRNRTPLGYYLAIYGLFIFAIATYMVIDVSLHRRSVAARLARLSVRFFDDMPLVVDRIRRMVRRRDSLRTGLYTALLLLVVLAALAVLRQWILVLLLPAVFMSVVLGLGGNRQPERVFVWLLAFTGFLVSLGIEFVFLRDWLQGGSAYRMNTLFKFGIQIWIFLALAAAAGLAVATGHIRPSLQRFVHISTLWYVTLAILLFCAILFPVLGIPARVTDRFPGARPPVGTLDGTAFMSVGRYTFDWERKNIAVDLRYDYEAIQWLLRNVRGSPVIAEAVLPYYRELGARVSAFTGLPTLVGNQHEQEQRPGDTQVGPRETETRLLYNDPGFDRIVPLLQKHRVRYIYVGQLEQAIYNAAGLAKFDQAVGSYLDVVFENAKVKIYKVRDW